MKNAPKLRMLILLSAFCIGCAADSASSNPSEKAGNKPCLKKPPAKTTTDCILQGLKTSLQKLKFYQADFQYTFVDSVLQARSKRRGRLYYSKPEKRSILRVNFQTLSADDEPEQKYAEDFLFDGVWLTRINYQVKQVDFYQKAPEDNPVDAFDLAGQELAIIGFAKIDEMKKQFFVSLIEAPPDVNDLNHLKLRVKPNSVYKDDYTAVDLWIDKKTSLPRKIVTKSTQQEIYELRLLNIKVNKKLPDSVFKVEIPENFTTRRETLPQKPKLRPKG